MKKLIFLFATSLLTSSALIQAMEPQLHDIPESYPHKKRRLEKGEELLFIKENIQSHEVALKSLLKTTHSSCKRLFQVIDPDALTQEQRKIKAHFKQGKKALQTYFEQIQALLEKAQTNHQLEASPGEPEDQTSISAHFPARNVSEYSHTSDRSIPLTAFSQFSLTDLPEEIKHHILSFIWGPTYTSHNEWNLFDLRQTSHDWLLTTNTYLEGTSFQYTLAQSIKSLCFAIANNKLEAEKMYKNIIGKRCEGIISPTTLSTSYLRETLVRALFIEQYPLFQTTFAGRKPLHRGTFDTKKGIYQLHCSNTQFFVTFPLWNTQLRRHAFHSSYNKLKMNFINLNRYGAYLEELCILWNKINNTKHFKYSWRADETKVITSTIKLWLFRYLCENFEIENFLTDLHNRYYLFNNQEDPFSVQFLRDIPTYIKQALQALKIEYEYSQLTQKAQCKRYLSSLFGRSRRGKTGSVEQLEKTSIFREILVWKTCLNPSFQYGNGTNTLPQKDFKKPKDYDPGEKLESISGRILDLCQSDLHEGILTLLYLQRTFTTTLIPENQKVFAKICDLLSKIYDIIPNQLQDLEDQSSQTSPPSDSLDSHVNTLIVCDFLCATRHFLKIETNRLLSSMEINNETPQISALSSKLEIAFLEKARLWGSRYAAIELTLQEIRPNLTILNEYLKRQNALESNKESQPDFHEALHDSPLNQIHAPRIYEKLLLALSSTGFNSNLYCEPLSVGRTTILNAISNMVNLSHFMNQHPELDDFYENPLQSKHFWKQQNVHWLTVGAIQLGNKTSLDVLARAYNIQNLKVLAMFPTIFLSDQHPLLTDLHTQRPSGLNCFQTQHPTVYDINLMS